MEHLMFEVEEQAKNDKSDVVSESVYVHFYCLFRGLQGCDIEREVSKLSVYLFVYQHLPSKGNISNMVDKYSGFIYFYGIDLSGLKKNCVFIVKCFKVL